MDRKIHRNSERFLTLEENDVMRHEFDLGFLDKPVALVMTKGVVSATPTTPFSIILVTMGKRNINRLPVLDSGSLVGIVSRTDLLNTLGALQ